MKRRNYFDISKSPSNIFTAWSFMMLLVLLDVGILFLPASMLPLAKLSIDSIHRLVALSLNAGHRLRLLLFLILVFGSHRSYYLIPLGQNYSNIIPGELGSYQEDKISCTQKVRQDNYFKKHHDTAGNRLL